jgi:hypothetical protein
MMIEMEKPKMEMKIVGFGCKHKFKDADGKEHKFTQKYHYIDMLCPRCKAKILFLYPALNQCPKCDAMIGFCSLNDGENRIGVWDIEALIKIMEKKDG